METCTVEQNVFLCILLTLSDVLRLKIVVVTRLLGILVAVSLGDGMKLNLFISLFL